MGRGSESRKSDSILELRKRGSEAEFDLTGVSQPVISPQIDIGDLRGVLSRSTELKDPKPDLCDTVARLLSNGAMVAQSLSNRAHGIKFYCVWEWFNRRTGKFMSPYEFVPFDMNMNEL